MVMMMSVGRPTGQRHATHMYLTHVSNPPPQHPTTPKNSFEFLPIKAPAHSSQHSHPPHTPDPLSLSGAAVIRASELGRGRFAVVRKARRRRYADDTGGDAEGGNAGGRGGDAVCALKIVNKAAFWTRVAEGA